MCSERVAVSKEWLLGTQIVEEQKTIQQTSRTPLKWPWKYNNMH